MSGARLYFLGPKQLAITDEENRLVGAFQRGYSLARVQGNEKLVERAPYNPDTEVGPAVDLQLKDGECPELMGSGEWKGVVQEVRLLNKRDYGAAMSRFRELTGELGPSNATLESFFLTRFFKERRNGPFSG